LVFHNEGIDVTGLMRKPPPQQAAQAARPSLSVEPKGAKKVEPVEEKSAVQVQSLAVQAEIAPPVEIIRQSEIDSPVGALSLSFNSPMKFSAPVPQEGRAVALRPPNRAPSAKIPMDFQYPLSRVPEQKIRYETTNNSDPVRNRPQRQQLCFVDEMDLDESDDMVALCRRTDTKKEPRKAVAPLDPIAQPKTRQGIARDNSSDNTRKGNNTTANIPVEKKFARYADFNWHYL
jgi:hypothetical protein